MAKICLISDSHGYKNRVESLVYENDYDYIFFMGDGLRDFEDIDLNNIKKVSGNCDLFNFEAITMFVNINKNKIMITHGHEYKAKLSKALMLKTAKENNCNIVCFGHTHKQFCEYIDDILFVNPGALKNGEYALLTINDDGTKSVEFKEL